MTKIKNTKKGMAKKTLSMSLVVAMLATSNVPVWAAEFSDGTDAAVATEAPAAETFSDTAEETPVVADTADVNAASEVITGKEYSVTYEPIKFTATGKTATPVADNSMTWADGTLSTTVSVTDNKVITGAKVYATWKVDNEVVGGLATTTEASFDSTTNIASIIPDAYTVSKDTANKKVALYVYAVKGNSVVWSYTSDEITVNPKNTADVVKATVNDTISYNGSIQQPTPTVESVVAGTTLPEEINNADDFTIGYDENSDFVNVTGKPITITLTPKSSAYKGSITATYEIKAKALSSSTDIANEMVATLKNTSYKFDGGSSDTDVIKVKKEDITLVDKATKKIDLSDYLKVDKNGYVNVTRDGKIELATPENGNKNYTISGTDDNAKIQSTNVPEVSARDLSTVTVTIDPVQGTGSKATLSSENVHFYDKDSKKALGLFDFVDIDIPNNAVAAGKYTVTITPKATTSSSKLTGKVTAELSIFATDINKAEFKKDITTTTPKTTESGNASTGYTIPESTVKKYYTGEPVTFTTDEIGVPTVGDNNTPLKDTDYEITYSNNTNAGTASMFLIGKDSYVNSIKKYTFTINQTPVTDVTRSEYVEKINGAKPEDYKTAMGVVVKAKVPGTNKVLTLTEGKDYTVKYEWGSDGKSVDATVTVKSNGNFATPSNTNILKVNSKISNATLKSEYIKLKETSFTYNGQAVKPDFDVVIGGHIIDKNNFDVKYTNNVNAGTATLTVSAKANSDYEGTASITYAIQPADASKLNGVIGTKAYTGYSLEVAADDIDLTLDGKKIDVANNFTLTYGENVKVGEGTVTLTPKNGNFTGTKTLTFQISGEMLRGTADFKYVDKDGFTVTTPVFAYDGTAQTCAKTSLIYVAKSLKEGTDYEIKYVDNVYGQKGKDGKQYAAVLAVAKGKFGGDLTATDTTSGISVKDGVYTDAAGNKTANVFYMELIEITQEAITANCVSVSNGTYAAGLPVKPSVKIVVKGRTLVEGTDYDLDVSANKDVINSTEKQTLLVTVKPKNGYKTGNDTLTYAWGIDKFDLANADVTVDGDKVTVKCGKVEVAADEYTVTKDAEANKVTVTATKDNKNYKGSKTVSAVVTDPTEKPGAPMISNVKVTGNKATVILSGDTEGAAGYDYVISTDRDCITNKDYASVNKNQVQTSTTFKYVQQGTYYAYCHAWKRDANGKKVFSDWSNAYPFVVSAITPDAPVITNVKVSGSTIKVTYKAAANATGYDVVLGTSSKKENGETRPYNYGAHKKLNLKEGTVTATFKNVPKGTWTVGMHAFNRTSEDGKKVFSPWSNLKKATVK